MDGMVKPNPGIIKPQQPTHYAKKTPAKAGAFPNIGSIRVS